jgi:hypothetical protein
VLVLKILAAVFVALVGIGLVREALREVVWSVRRLRTLPRLPGTVVAHERQERMLTSFGVGSSRMRVRRYTVHLPIVEVKAPDGRAARKRLGFGEENPNRYPLGSTIEVLWDPAAGEIVEKPGLATVLLVVGALGIGGAIVAAAVLWAQGRLGG